MFQYSHIPVMIKEIEEVFPLCPGCTYVDGTLGLGGHASYFMNKILPNGKMIGFDWDRSMLEKAKNRLNQFIGLDAEYINKDYREIPNQLKSKAQAILLDLGLNNAQIEDPNRGFSFKTEGPLEMRMDTKKRFSAAEILNSASISELSSIFWQYGDEKWSKRIAEKIVDRRRENPLKTTTDLVECVYAAIPMKARTKNIHPATRVFQALRIYVNEELDELEQTMYKIANCLSEGGVLAVLSYHSGEDREVKRAFKSLQAEGTHTILFKKPKTPSSEEVNYNPKSRSAKLRAIQCIKKVKA